MKGKHGIKPLHLYRECKSKATVNGAMFQQASACSKTCTPKKEECTDRET